MAELASIIVLTRDRWPELRRSLAALRRRTAAGSYELLVVDNASKDGTLSGLRRLSSAWPELRVFCNDRNQPFAAAVNLGMRAARGRYFVWLNDDTTVTRGWLEGLSAAVESEGDVFAAGPMTDRMAPPAQLGARDAGLEETPFLGGFCFLVKREAVDAAGLLDERFVWGWEDMDYSLRLRHAGGRLVIAKGVFVRHEGSRTIKTLPPAQRQRDDLRNRRLIARKWASSEPFRGELARLFAETPAPWHRLRPKASVFDLRAAAGRAGREKLEASEVGATFEVLRPRAPLGAELNRLARRARGEYLVALDARLAIEKGWLEGLLARLPSQRAVAAEGGTLLVPRAVFERVGSFDERFGAASAIADYVLRCRQEGVVVAGSPAAPDDPRLAAKWRDARLAPGPLPVATVVIAERGRGSWARRVNRELNESLSEHVVVVGEGVRPPRASIETMRRAARLESNIALVSPWNRADAALERSEAGPVRRAARASSHCFLIPRRMFERVGPFDERFAGTLALIDYCFRAHQLGLQVVVAERAPVPAPRRGPDARRVKDFRLLFSKWSGYELFDKGLFE